MLLDGGVPLNQAISITADSLPSALLRSELIGVQGDVEQGRSLEESLAETRVDSVVSEMVKVGEATGTLSDIFEYLAVNGEEKAEDQLDRISNIIAPIILLTVGVAIAGLVLAMYLPMIGLADLFDNFSPN